MGNKSGGNVGGDEEMRNFTELSSLFNFSFSRRLESLFSLHNAVIILSAAVCIVTCLMVVVKQRWLLGLAIIGIAWFQIIFITSYGAAYETAYKGFAARVYDIDWHLLSPKHRKHWVLILILAQNPPRITIGGFWTANLKALVMVSRRRTKVIFIFNAASLQVIQNVYSVLMLLLHIQNRHTT